MLGLMPIPQEINDILSEFGLPATAIALAVGLVRGARALEADANPHALKYVAGLLRAGNVAAFGKVGAILVPLIFDRVFGSNFISWKFISRSVLATTIFWLSLLAIKHPSWPDVFSEVITGSYFYPSLALNFYFFDWLSLIKAKLIVKILSQRYAVRSAGIFLVIDMLGSYLISLFALVFLFCILKTLVDHEWPHLTEINPTFEGYMSLLPIRQYFGLGGIRPFIPSNVIVPSTMLTSVWTLLIFVSSMIALLLVPVDYIRRFTTWWFRDIENHPLTAVAKVGAILTILGAMVIKAARWI
jgi:hypothetical protein